MNALLKRFQKFTVDFVNIISVSFNWATVLKRREGLFDPFIKLGHLILGQRTQEIALAITSIVRNLRVIHSHMGTRYISIYLKASIQYLYSTAAGNPEKDSSAFGVKVSVTGKGIPRWIPSTWRPMISQTNWRFVLVLSICNLYRVLDCQGRLKLKTITDVFTGVDKISILPSAVLFGKKFAARFTPAPLSYKLPRMLNAGPSSPYKVKGLNYRIWESLDQETTDLFQTKQFKDTLQQEEPLVLTSQSQLLPYLATLSQDPVLWSALVHVLVKTKQFKLLEILVMLLVHLQERSVITITKPLGSLSTKDEPNKVRVFAIVDSVTQISLYQLHKRLFDLLQSHFVENDATFDQEKGVERARVILRKKLQETGRAFVVSYDLSAATDRLPSDVQAAILNGITEGLGDAWKALLVDRDYQLPSKYTHLRGHTVRYSVGQPIGAYSSWAILALTHHFIVWHAANLARLKHGSIIPVHFKEYIVLGDDIIIWNELVAKSYYQVIALDLGVGINLSKSLKSTKGVFEFAKRLVDPNLGMISGVPLKEWSIANKSLSVLLMILQNFRITTTPSVVLRIIGFKHVVLAKLYQAFNGARASYAKLFSFIPGTTTGSALTWVDWFLRNSISHRGSTQSPHRLYDLQKLFVDLLNRGLESKVNSLNKLTELIHRLYSPRQALNVLILQFGYEMWPILSQPLTDSSRCSSDDQLMLLLEELQSLQKTPPSTRLFYAMRNSWITVEYWLERQSEIDVEPIGLAKNALYTEAIATINDLRNRTRSASIIGITTGREMENPELPSEFQQILTELIELDELVLNYPEQTIFILSKPVPKPIISQIIRLRTRPVPDEVLR